VPLAFSANRPQISRLAIAPLRRCTGARDKRSVSGTKMEDKQLARSPHAREPRNSLLERPARPTRSIASGTPLQHSTAVPGDNYRLPDAPLLTREQEHALARDIEALEIAHWSALLSHVPAVPTVAQAVAQSLPRPCVALQEASQRTSLTAAERKTLSVELRELDIERTALRETDAYVRSVWEKQPRARAFLARIDAARAAQTRMKSRFVASNLRLVVRLSRAYDSGMLDKADLIQEGNIGLMRAVERFDHRRGLRFSTYASWWIRHHLNRAVADKGRLVRVPVHATDTHRRVKQAQRKYLTLHGVAPSVAELASSTGLPHEAIEQALQTANAAPRSLDRPLHGDSERTLHDVLGDPEQINAESDIIQSDRARVLNESLRVLTSFEAAVLRFRYGLDGDEALTLREVGEKYNLSRERIRQVQEVALAKLRNALDHTDNTAPSAVA
jgi:RNA polymerase primary sigma factor